MYEKIIITFRNGEQKIYNNSEWSDYRYDGKVISVINNGAIIGIFNIDVISRVELEK